MALTKTSSIRPIGFDPDAPEPAHVFGQHRDKSIAEFPCVVLLDSRHQVSEFDIARRDDGLLRMARAEHLIEMTRKYLKSLSDSSPTVLYAVSLWTLYINHAIFTKHEQEKFTELKGIYTMEKLSEMKMKIPLVY